MGLEAQRETIDGYIKSVRGKLVSEVVEIESGKSARNRPKLKRAVRECQLRSATLVVARLDRLSRDLFLITAIQKLGIRFVCADSPEINELTIHILGAIAQYERKLISDRTRLALAAARRRGTRLGGPNLHLHRNKDTRKANTQRRVMAIGFSKRVFPLIQEIKQKLPGASLRIIADELNTLGIATRHGSGWTPTSVRRVLLWLPEAYTGEEDLDSIG